MHIRTSIASRTQWTASRETSEDDDDGGGQVPGTHTRRGGGGATLIDTSARDVMRIPSPTTTTTVAPHWWYKTCLTAVHHLSHFHFFLFFFPVISHPLHFRQKGTRSTIPLMFSTMKQSSAVVEHGKQQERKKRRNMEEQLREMTSCAVIDWVRRPLAPRCRRFLFPPTVAAERLDVCVLTFLDQLQKFRIKKWGRRKKKAQIKSESMVAPMSINGREKSRGKIRPE